jgi:hypothetical protein
LTTASIASRIGRSGFGFRYLLLLLVRLYRVAISPVMPAACRCQAAKLLGVNRTTLYSRMGATEDKER